MLKRTDGRPRTRASTRLRQSLAQDKLLVAPFCYDATQAKIAEYIGFSAVYMTGSGTAGSKGFPDVGLLTMTEMVQNAKYLADAVDIPVIADSDNGYGSPLNCWRTVREYEIAGVGGVHIEDQTFPKKCGFFEGKAVVPVEDGVQKIRAAVDARTDPDFLLIARCDALAINGWEDTVRRCQEYMQAGADMIFVDGIRTEDDLKTYAEELSNLPKLYNGGILPTQDVQKLGFMINITGGTNQIVFDATWDSMENLMARSKGEEAPWAQGSDEGRIVRTDLLGLPRVYEMEREYGVKTAISEDLASRGPRFSTRAS